MPMQESHTSPAKDKLFAATQIMPVVPGKMTITVTAKRGTLVTAAGAKATSVSDAYAVVAADVEAGKETGVYLTGEFNSVALSEATGIEVADGAIIQNRIFVKTNLEA